MLIRIFWMEFKRRTTGLNHHFPIGTFLSNTLKMVKASDYFHAVVLLIAIFCNCKSYFLCILEESELNRMNLWKSPVEHSSQMLANQFVAKQTKFCVRGATTKKLVDSG